MFYHTYIYICLFLSLLQITVWGQNGLSGKVTDKGTGESLPGAAIYLPDLKVGTTSDEEGYYTLKNLPNTAIIVQVTYLGYKSAVATIDVRKKAVYNFELTISAIEAQEVVVTGNVLSSDNQRSSIAITPIGREQLMTGISTNLINSISKIPGVSEITTGSGISKPVIRGLGYNHIVTINEGIRQEGNQWGDEHGIEIDQFSADRIEVLKGPASLFYGSDAMGGVINILEPVPAELNTIGGEYISQFAVNGEVFSNSLMVQGNHDGWIWRVRGSYKNAASWRTPTEWVYNSGYREFDGSAMAGVVKKWGFSHLHFSTWNTDLGMIEGERDSLTGRFTDYTGKVITGREAASRDIDVPFQIIHHQKISSVTHLLFGKSKIKVNLGYQENDREEYGESKEEAGLFFHLKTMTYDVKYLLRAGDSTELAAGFSGMTQQNENRGPEYLVPDYHLQDLGGFIYAKRSWEKVTINLGIRFDHRYVAGDPLIQDLKERSSFHGDTIFQSFTTGFTAITGSTGLTYQPNENWHMKLNLGRGFRAPNIAELASNGVHEGTFRYEIGNADLQSETSFQIDGEIGWGNKAFNIALNGYYNIIDQYIYLCRINQETIEVAGDLYPLYRYVQGNSLIGGFEAEIDIHPVDALHIDNSLDYVRGQNLSTDQPLPFIPAMHLSNEVKWTFKTKKNSRIKQPYAGIEIETHFRQDKTDQFETHTPGYTLLNASAGAKIRIQRQWMTVFLNGENLTNVRYYDHLSRLKEVGIYNKGVNINIGVIIHHL